MLRATIEKRRATIEMTRDMIEILRATIEMTRAMIEKRRATIKINRATIEKRRATNTICTFGKNQPMYKALLLSLLTLTIVSGCSPSAQLQSEPAGISEANKANARQFAETHFNACTTGKYVPLTTATAIPELVRSLTVADMQKACAEINASYGQLVSLRLKQILTTRKTYIYRYMATYSKTTEPQEIRVYTSMKHKFSGLIFKPQWTDEYTKFKPANNE